MPLLVNFKLDNKIPRKNKGLTKHRYLIISIKKNKNKIMILNKREKNKSFTKRIT